MKDLLMGTDGDMYHDGLDAVMIEGADFVRQTWTIKMRTYRQEWFLDELIGIPYIQEIFTKQASYRKIKQIFADESLTVEGVTNVNNVVINKTDGVDRSVDIDLYADIEGEDNALFSFSGGI